MLPYPSTGDALLLVNLPPASPWQQLPVGAHLMPSLDSTSKLSPSAVEMILTPCLQWALRNRTCVSLLVGGGVHCFHAWNLWVYWLARTPTATRKLKQQKFICSALWRLEVHDQGAGRWFLARPLSTACRRLPSLCILTLSFLCAHVSLAFLCTIKFLSL